MSLSTTGGSKARAGGTQNKGRGSDNATRPPKGQAPSSLSRRVLGAVPPHKGAHEHSAGLLPACEGVVGVGPRKMRGKGARVPAHLGVALVLPVASVPSRSGAGHCASGGPPVQDVVAGTESNVALLGASRLAPEPLPSPPASPLSAHASAGKAGKSGAEGAPFRRCSAVIRVAATRDPRCRWGSLGGTSQSPRRFRPDGTSAKRTLARASGFKSKPVAVSTSAASAFSMLGGYSETFSIVGIMVQYSVHEEKLWKYL